MVFLSVNSSKMPGLQIRLLPLLLLLLLLLLLPLLGLSNSVDRLTTSYSHSIQDIYRGHSMKFIIL